MHYQSLCIISKPWVNSNWNYSPETLNSGQNRRFIVPCDLEIWWTTLKNNRAPLLCHFKLCASFHSHRWIKTKAIVRKPSIRVKIEDLLSRVTLKYNGWHWKTVGHLFYVASSFMHNFIAICELKLKLQSGNAQSGSKSTILGSCDLEIWRMTLNKANLRDLIAATGLVILLKWDSNRRFFSPCDLEIWWMTSKNYRTPLLHYIKLCASSQTPRWIQTGVTVRKRSIRFKIGDFLSRVTLKFDGWPWKTIGLLFYATISFVHHFKAIGEFKLEL